MGEKREAILGIGQMKKGDEEIHLPQIPQFAPVAIEKVQAVSVLMVSFLTNKAKQTKASKQSSFSCRSAWREEALRR